MNELTDVMARKLDRASQILSGLSRVASKDCDWLRSHPELHSELLDLQNELRAAAAPVTGSTDLGTHLKEARTVGNQLYELFKAEKKQES